jgi:hypothetical protein
MRGPRRTEEPPAVARPRRTGAMLHPKSVKAKEGPLKIPCTCDGGRPCGKVLVVEWLSDGRPLMTIMTAAYDVSVLLDDDGRKRLVEALGDSP